MARARRVWTCDEAVGAGGVGQSRPPLGSFCGLVLRFVVLAGTSYNGADSLTKEGPVSVPDVPNVHAPGFRDTGTIRFMPDSETVLARMERSTVEVFTSLTDYVEAYGPYVDRLGYPTGKYFWRIPLEREPQLYYFEERAQDIFALRDPIYEYEITNLPPGFCIRTGINVPQFDLRGGARQVQFLAGQTPLTALECLELGILAGKVVR